MEGKETKLCLKRRNQDQELKWGVCDCGEPIECTLEIASEEDEVHRSKQER